MYSSAVSIDRHGLKASSVPSWHVASTRITQYHPKTARWAWRRENGVAHASPSLALYLGMVKEPAGILIHLAGQPTVTPTGWSVRLRLTSAASCGGHKSRPRVNTEFFLIDERAPSLVGHCKVFYPVCCQVVETPATTRWRRRQAGQTAPSDMSPMPPPPPGHIPGVAPSDATQVGLITA